MVLRYRLFDIMVQDWYKGFNYNQMIQDLIYSGYMNG